MVNKWYKCSNFKAIQIAIFWFENKGHYFFKVINCIVLLQTLIRKYNINYPTHIHLVNNFGNLEFVTIT